MAVILVTTSGDPRSAVAAIRSGAQDYLCKPLDTDELLSVVQRSLEQMRLGRAASRIRASVDERDRLSNIVGGSVEMTHLFRELQQVAPSRATVLITGESGTGKELVARAIHRQSPRANGPFVALHCAALAETLLESEIFGHERGAFTGAAQRRKGRLEEANGGTLFLDEIGDISAGMQLKLLRVLQERAFERVGSNETQHTDVRFVAATNRDLRELVAQGKFREDLWYRLNVVNLCVPPLRERKGDVILLAMHFLHERCEQEGRPSMRFEDAALARLVSYSWPGNVRELENAIERAVVLAPGDVVETAHLPPEMEGRPTHGFPPIPGSSLSELERYAILRTLEANGGSSAKAAKALGISVRKIQYRLQQYSAAPRQHIPTLRPFRPARQLRA